MSTWATTTYTPVEGGALQEHHRDLTPDELPSAVYAVEASDSGGRSYSSNGLRWVSPADARVWASGLALRWFGCTNIRVVRIAEPPESGPFTGYTVAEVVEQTL